MQVIIIKVFKYYQILIYLLYVSLTNYFKKNDNDEMYGNAYYYFFYRILFESQKSYNISHIDRVEFA